MPGSGGFTGGAAYRNRTDDLRITSVFSCVARGFGPCPSIRFTGWRWWGLLALDGGSGTSWGHIGGAIDPLLRRPVCAAGQPAILQVSRCIRLSGNDRDYPALTGRSGTQRARLCGRAQRLAPRRPGLRHRPATHPFLGDTAGSIW